MSANTPLEKIETEMLPSAVQTRVLGAMYAMPTDTNADSMSAMIDVRKKLRRCDGELRMPVRVISGRP